MEPPLRRWRESARRARRDSAQSARRRSADFQRPADARAVPNWPSPTGRRSASSRRSCAAIARSGPCPLRRRRPNASTAAPWPHEAPKRASIEALRLKPTKPDWSGELGLGEVAGRRRRARLAQDLRRGGAERLRGRARHPCAGRRLAPVGELALRRDLAAPHRARGRNRGGREAWAGRRGGEISGRAHLARFATALLDAHPDMATRCLRPEFERFPWRHDEDGFSRLGAWAHRLSDRRRRDAAIVAHGIFAQSRAPDRRFVPRQAPAHRLAARRGMVLGYADRRRSGQQSAQLAMGRGRPASNSAPYFRIFNPVLQAEKFDPDGAYVRQWVPELARLETPAIHSPWTGFQRCAGARGSRVGQNLSEADRRSWPSPRPVRSTLSPRCAAADRAGSVSIGSRSQRPTRGSPARGARTRSTHD